MEPTPPILIERSGENWYFSMDTSPVPEYMLLTFKGRPSPARTQSFLEMLQTHEADLTDANGRFYPVLADMRALPTPTSDSIKAGWAMVEGITRRQSYLVMLINANQRRAALFNVLLGVITRLIPGDFSVAHSYEEALAQLRAYHERRQ